MKIKYAMAFLLVSLLTLNAFGQINAITEKGDSIIIYSNGTWKDKLPTVSAEPIDSNVNATVTVDEFSNKKSIKTENWLSFGVSKSKSKLSGYATYYNEGIYAVNLSISSDLGCMLQQDSTLKVKLSNGEIVEFIQVSKTDCGRFVSASFAPVTEVILKNEDYKVYIKENVELLKEYDWVSMRIQGTEYYTDISPRISKKFPNPEQFFRQHFIAIDGKL